MAPGYGFQVFLRIAIQNQIRVAQRVIKTQKIRTLLLSEKSSDFVVVVHLQGLEPWAH